MAVETEDLTDDQIEQMAKAADSGASFDLPDTQTEETRDSSSTESDASTAATHAGAKETQEPVSNLGKPEAAKPETEKKESKFEAAKKEADRRDRSWKALEAEKEATRKDRETLEQQRAELQRKSDELNRQVLKPATKPAEPIRDEAGYTAEDYERYAKDQEAEGNFTYAERAKARAKDLRSKEQAQALAPAPQTAGPSPISKEAWSAEVDSVVAKVPELKDENSPLAKAVTNLLQTEGIFSLDPKGFSKAVAVSRLQLQAARAIDLEKLVATQKSEIERLNAALSVGGSNPVQASTKTKSADELSDAEFEQMLAQADRDGRK